MRKKKISIRLDEKDSYDVTVSLLSAIPAYMEMNEQNENNIEDEAVNNIEKRQNLYQIEDADALE